MILEHLQEPRKQKNGDTSLGHRRQPQQPNLEQLEHKSAVMLDYNPKYDINIYEFILT